MGLESGAGANGTHSAPTHTTMSVSHTTGPRARPFVVTPYRPGQDGILVPDMPTEGSCGLQSGTPCRLTEHHRRSRKTGPCFPLTVVRCRSHRYAFTLYPPGHVPYGRVAVTPIAFDGAAVVGSPQAERFVGTLFEAAVDAAAGRPWHRECEGGSDRWWSSQGRWLQLATLLVGVAVGLSSRCRQQLAAVLSVDVLLLHEQAKRQGQSPGYRQRGQAVVTVLESLPKGHFLFDRLAECGHLTGRWGAPHRWLPHTTTLCRQPFRALGMATAPRPP